MNIGTLAKLVPLLALVAFLAAFAACGDDDDDDDTTTASPTAAGATTQAPTAAASPTGAAEDGLTVTVGDNFFSPATLTVKAGDTVRWEWSGSLPHSVRFEDESSPTHTGSGEFELTFDEPGTYDYVCGVHGESMPGTIVVE